MERMSERYKPYLAGTVFIIIVGFSFLMIKLCVPFADTMQIMTWRYNFALIAVLLMMAVSHRKIRDLFSKDKLILLIPATFYTLCLCLQTVGMRFSTTVEATILFSTSPLIVHIIAVYFLKEKATRLQALAVIVSFAALVIMELRAHSVSFDPFGSLMLLAASVCMALNTIYVRKYSRRGTPFDVTAIIVIEGWIAFNSYSIIFDMTSGDPARYFRPVGHIQFTLAAAYLGVFCIMLSAQTMNYMLHRLQAVNAAIFSNGSTIITIIAGALLLREPVGSDMIICAIIIFASIILISSEGEKLRKAERL